MLLYNYFIYFITGVLVLIAAIKTVLFFMSTSNRRLQNWFFFSNYAIYNSRSDRSKKLKQLQNRLTILIFCLLLIDVAIYVLFR